MCGLEGQVNLNHTERDIAYNRKLLEAARAANKQILINLAIIPTRQGMMVCNDSPYEYVEGTFGWMAEYKGRSRLQFNTRVEGGFRNKSNDPAYDGPYDIFTNPYVKEIIGQTCVVPVNYFGEQPEGNSKEDKRYCEYRKKWVKRKYLIKREDEKVFYIGGLFTDLVNEETGEINRAFTIMTTPYSPITKAIGHSRSPLIIPDEEVELFLSPDLEKEDLRHFFKVHDAKGFVAHEVEPIISARTKNPFPLDDKRLIEPIGDLVYPE